MVLEIRLEINTGNNYPKTTSISTKDDFSFAQDMLTTNPD